MTEPDRQQASEQMKSLGVILIVVGAVFHVGSGTLLDRYAEHVDQASDLGYVVASNLFSVVDAILIPLGVGLLVGGLVVQALRDAGR